jgi:nitroreductase
MTNESDPTSASAFRSLVSDRRSCRGFLPEPLPKSLLNELFATAQCAPSWCNVQPWRIAVTEPPCTAKMTAALVAAASAEPACADVPFPVDYPSPYLEHRRACGGALYGAMGIARGDKDRRREAWLRNYRAFDAPHIAIVSCDRRLGPYAYLDVGVWLGTLLAAAASLGIATCPMASIAGYPKVLRAHLPIADTEVILVGIALGTSDPDVPANRCRTPRDPVHLHVQFVR